MSRKMFYAVALAGTLLIAGCSDSDDSDQRSAETSTVTETFLGRMNDENRVLYEEMKSACGGVSHDEDFIQKSWRDNHCRFSVEQETDACVSLSVPETMDLRYRDRLDPWATAADAYTRTAEEIRADCERLAQEGHQR